MRRAKRTELAAALAAGLLLAGLLGILSRPRAPRAPAAPRAGVVSRVYDGDTIDVTGIGRVRLLGIDAMDGHNTERTAEQARHYGMPAARVRDWAGRATAFARAELDGRTVTLHWGAELLDSYGRTLAYVHVASGEAGEGRDFNLTMVREGLAAAYRRFEHPRRAGYLAAEKEAREERTGLWRDARFVP